jgi:ABC-type uncharacterized transport system substrate-binding protein
VSTRSFVSTLRSLGLGLLLIILAAGVLLYSDLGSRHRLRPAATTAVGPFRVAVIQHASLPALDDGVRGVLEGLRSRGYADGGRLTVRQYNAQADMSTANAIAKDVTSGDYDLIVTVSTASLQTVANANRFATPPRKHVFGVTSDPYGAGVGVSRDNHSEHPPYMTGLGSLPPVEEAFRLAKDLKPDLKRVGLVWNPTEANSVAATALRRKISADLGITLVEANAENATAAGEAGASVLSRGIDALWVSPDVTVVTAIDVLLAAARRARIPVFTSLPGYAEKGALFDLGADYVGIGRAEGDLAADVLDGRDPASVPVENLAPVELHINRLALDGLRDTWKIPDGVASRADVLIDASGKHPKEKAPALALVGGPSGAAASNAGSSSGSAVPKPLARKMTVDLIEYVDSPNAEMAVAGVMQGLKDAGLVVGKDLDIRRNIAQGDIATLSSIIDNALTQRTDLMITVSTPTLQTAIARGKGTPTVFTMVSSPFVVNAGKTNTDHLPFVTGTYLDQPYKELFEALREFRPPVKRIGTLYCPAELNAVWGKEQLERGAKEFGLGFEAVAVTNTSEVTEATLSLAHRNINVLTQIADNVTASSFPALMEAARRVRLPVTAYSPAFADMGPILILARDYHDNGVESGKMAARVLRGESPGRIPFFAVPTLSYIINLRTASTLNIQLSPQLMAKAARVIR